MSDYQEKGLLPLDVFAPFYEVVLWLHFQGVWENRIGNAIIIVSKNKICKISELSLISLAVMFVLFVALSVLRLLIYFIISWRSTWEKLKDKPELQFFFIATMLGWNLYFMIAFISGSPILWLNGAVLLYWGIPSVVMILEKILFKINIVLLSFYIILPSSTRVILTLWTFLFHYKGLTTSQIFLLLHKCVSFRFPKNSLLLFRKSITHKFIYLA